MSKTQKNLIFLERQFNTIKGLIPIANLCVSESVLPDKLIKGFFREHLTYWDVIQSSSEKKLWKVDLTEEEEQSVRESIILMMDL